MSDVLQVIIIVIAIAAFIFLTVKGLGPIPSALIATAIVSFIAIDGFEANFFGSFLNGITSMYTTFFLLFTFGVIFGAVLNVCGAGDSIGRTIIGSFGEKYFIIAIIIVGMLIGMTGAVPLAIMPGMCFGMIKSAKLPRYIAMATVAGTTSISTTTVIGTLGAGNVTAAQVLGTNVYAGVWISIPATIAGIILLWIYIMHLIKKARQNGEGYDPVEGDVMMDASSRSDDEIPPFWSSILPVIFVLACCAICTLALDFTSLAATVYSTVGGTILLVILNYKYIKGNLLHTIRDAAVGIQWNIASAVSVVGFASVISNTTAFNSIIGGLTNATIHPYLLILVAVFVTAALCADCIGGVAVFLNTIGIKLLESGVNAEVIHRLANIASSTFDSMPHGGSMVLALNQFGYTHKQAYKYLVMTNIVIPLVYTAVGLVCAFLFY